MKSQTYADYIGALFSPQGPSLKASPSGASQAKLLQVLALTVSARRILEIGTLAGYSGIHLARTLPPEGKLVTLEIDPARAEVARRNFERSGLGGQVEIRVGKAVNSLRELRLLGDPLFDMIFIDADKDEYSDYLRLALPLLRDGGLLVADNTRPDAVPRERESRYSAEVAAHPDLTTVVVPVLGQKSVHGLAVSVKTSRARAASQESYPLSRVGARRSLRSEAARRRAEIPRSL